jgi:hypothetical protein
LIAIWRIPMGKLSFAVAAALVLSVAGAQAAAYCAYAGGGRGGSYENCGYYTWEQCLASVRGVGGFCMRNPHAPEQWGAPAPAYRYHRHAY